MRSLISHRIYFQAASFLYKVTKHFAKKKKKSVISQERKMLLGFHSEEEDVEPRERKVVGLAE